MISTTFPKYVCRTKRLTVTVGAIGSSIGRAIDGSIAIGGGFRLARGAHGGIEVVTMEGKKVTKRCYRYLVIEDGGVVVVQGEKKKSGSS